MNKRFTGLFAICLLALASLPAGAAEKVRFVLDWFPSGYISFTHVGIKEGFFAAEGLDVSIDIGRGGADAVTRVASGTDDFGGASMASLMSAQATTPIPAKAIVAVYSKSPDAIITKSGSGISAIKDLAGKTVATAAFSGSNALWPVIAKMNGLDPNSVRLLKVDDNALGPMLLAGKVDAVIAWTTEEPNFSTLLTGTTTRLTVLPWFNVGLQGYNWSVLASGRIIQDHPDTVKKFARAYLRAMQFVVDHPEKAAEDLHEMVPDTNVAISVEEIKAMKPLVINEISARTGLGRFDPALVGDAWKWVSQSQGFAADRIDPQSVIDRSFVP